MRVLFFLHVLGRVRHFKRVVEEMAARGHDVTLAPAPSETGTKAGRGWYDQRGVTVVPCPTEREDRWRESVEAMRLERDHLRYFDPRYARASALAARAEVHTPKAWRDTLARHPGLTRHWRITQRAFEWAEAMVPCDPGQLRYVADQRPDVMLVTPLVEFGSYQTDYVKCAHALGIPVLYLPFSWDNLTNRGLVRVAPDRALVWNAHQAREAVDLHGLPATSITVVGAPRFDDFFDMRPRATRARFFASLGLDPSQPLVLYLCSSGFVAPYEVDFVRQWIRAVRSSGSPWLTNAQILVRPHPAFLEHWTGTPLADLPGVAVWSRKSSLQADQGLYDALFHAGAVVGLNTSAMIEAAIVGRPIYTLSVPEFSGGQSETFHWHYLLVPHGGVVSAAETMEAHVRDLSRAPDDAPAVAVRSRTFLESFVRPRGVDTPVSGLMVDAIEQAVRDIRKAPRRSTLAQHAGRWLLDTAMRAGLERAIVRSH